MKSEFFPNCFHRVTIKGLCVQNDKLLLVKESDELSGQWELPGGGLDFGEDIHTALKREIEEEMGLNVTSVSKNPLYAWTCRFDNKREVDWFYSLVLAYKIELENTDFTATEECVAVDFFDKEQLQTLDLFIQSMKLREIFNPSDFAKRS